ncbi:MAG: polysaccharide biosynthesis protein [Candidatus Binatia bacterium]
MKELLAKLLAYRRIGIGTAHVAIVATSYVAAILLRFEFSFPERETPVLIQALPALVVCRLIFFSRYELFSGWWQYVGVRDVVDILKSTTAGTVAFVLVVVLTGAFPGFPRSLWILEWLLTLQFLAGARVGSRLLRSLALRLRVRTSRNVLIVGSGPLAESTLRDLNEVPSDRRPVGFLDDGSVPGLRRLRGLPVLGAVEDLSRVIRDQKISEVFIAMPSAQHDRARTVIRGCRSAGVAFRILPSVREHLDQPRTWDLASLEQLFDVDDLRTNEASCHELFYQKTVLILGAGGQMGGALAREIGAAGPRDLVLLDRNESTLYYLEVDFLKRAEIVRLTPVIADLNDPERLRQVVSVHRPDVVVHAAAYTRTELIVDNRDEIRENNLRGTENVLRICDELEVPRLIVLSADESDAGDLGCLRRAAEHLVRRHAGRGFVRAAVRFPNVLGSPRCIVTGAARSLQERRPIETTATDTRVRVVSLQSVCAVLIEAFAIAEDGDVLAIDVGKPQSLLEVVRYLRQVWNLPEVPFQRPRATEDHAHPTVTGTVTSHPRIVRRDPEAPPPCVIELLETLDGPEAKGGKLLEGSSSR